MREEAGTGAGAGQQQEVAPQAVAGRGKPAREGKLGEENVETESIEMKARNVAEAAAANGRH